MRANEREEMKHSEARFSEEKRQKSEWISLFDDDGKPRWFRRIPKRKTYQMLITQHKNEAKLHYPLYTYNYT